MASYMAVVSFDGGKSSTFSSACRQRSNSRIAWARSPIWANAFIRLRTAPSCVGSKLISRRAAAARTSGFAFCSLSGEPVIKRGCDPVEIFEEALAIGLDEVTGIRCGIGARLDDCKRIDPALPNIDANAVATDLYETGNVS